MNKILNIIFGLLLLSFSEQSSAQIWLQCVDSNRVNPYFQCNQPYFQPVCGCDFKTYRNECTAFNAFGVTTLEYAGVCTNDIFAFDIYPNPASYRLSFALEMAIESPVSIEIWDSFGKIMFLRNLASARRTDFFIDLGSYRPGVYIIVVKSGGKIDYKKFIKSDR